MKRFRDYSLKKKLTIVVLFQTIVPVILFLLAMSAMYMATAQYGKLAREAGVSPSQFAAVEQKRTVIARILLAVLVIFIPLMIVGVSFVLKAIREPVITLKEGILKAAQGENVRVEKYGNDEIGQIADAVNELTANMQKQAEVAQKVADGDLSVAVIPRSDKDTLNIALRQLVEDNNMAMVEMKRSTEQVSESSDQVAAASQALAQGSTEQASAITQITASIEEIAQRTKVNAGDANHANELVGNARNGANLGNQRMNDMIVAMSEINESSENISRIIKVIDDIAFQTNILALNAAVEAARAGSQGRGFAVVADEVRSLAGKSAQAASETAELIENSIAKVNKGSKLAEETAKALKDIVSAIEQVAEIIGSIALASNEQAIAVNQINQAIGQVSVVIQNNSSTSEECAAASEILSMQALKLREMIDHYKLSDSDPAKKSKRFSDDKQQTAGLLEARQDRREEKPVISLEDGFGKY